jgi:hypothetical protein
LREGEIGMDKKTLREKVRALDRMPRSVASEEADLIAFIQDKLKTGKKISPEEAGEIEEIYLRYLGPKGDEEAAEDPADEDGVDEDDFV